MKNNDSYRLEYNQIQGAFHWDDGSHKPNEFGWETVCGDLSITQCMEFCEMIDIEFLSPIDTRTEHGGGKSKYPTITEIKKEFEKFLLSHPKI